MGKPLNTGVSLEEWQAERGVARGAGTTMEEVKGVPHSRKAGFGAPANVPPPSRTTCLGVTKKGEDCSAPRVTGKQFCVGHLRSMGESFGDED